METINKTKKKDILLIDPRILKIEEGFNTRFDYGDIESLKNSIIENGVLIPLTGYKEDDKYVIIAGHRRHMAINMAIEEGVDIARVPFISCRKPTMEDRLFETLLSNDGKEMTLLELGETYKRLLKYGLTIVEIAKRIGKTYKHVSDMINVASSGKDIKTLVSDGNISATLVAEIKAKVKDVDKAEEIIKSSSKQKEESSGNKKITKRDIIDLDFNIKKPIEKTYSFSELKTLLMKQIQACADRIDDEDDKFIILKTKLVIQNISEEVSS